MSDGQEHINPHQSAGDERPGETVTPSPLDKVSRRFPNRPSPPKSKVGSGGGIGDSTIQYTRHHQPNNQLVAGPARPDNNRNSRWTYCYYAQHTEPSRRHPSGVVC